jgi:hypothetical protein
VGHALILVLFSFVVWIALPPLAPRLDLYSPPIVPLIVLALALYGLWLGVRGYRSAE